MIRISKIKLWDWVFTTERCFVTFKLKLNSPKEQSLTENQKSNKHKKYFWAKNCEMQHFSWKYLKLHCQSKQFTPIPSVLIQNLGIHSNILLLYKVVWNQNHHAPWNWVRKYYAIQLYNKMARKFKWLMKCWGNINFIIFTLFLPNQYRPWRSTHQHS